ncbi:MAG: SDR family oxidoreductase [Candidatus Dormibacteraeota bacterium]|nr:SDR family oxidoreductase [Candidatus Dormibacteraeota bacterium]
MRTALRMTLAAALAGGALAARDWWWRQREEGLEGQVAVVTGGSRGLGLLVARELARQGCRVAICARHSDELEKAARILRTEGLEALTVPCDVSDRAQVEEMVRRVTDELGPVDVLVNNAGIIQVGPLEAMDEADFRRSMDVMYWGVVHPTLAVLPEMRRRRRGRLVNVTSIGGKIAVPHLLPYSAAKFAAVGFSEGLRAELQGSGVMVTTVVPGLMRTGSHLNAEFKGKTRDEFTWFSLGATLPLISMDAERAAGRIVTATRRGEPEVILSLPATLAVRVHGFLPGLVTDLLGAVGRILPAAGSTTGSRRGGEAYQRSGRWLKLATALGSRAAARNNEA